jgi:hypothetical protein
MSHHWRQIQLAIDEALTEVAAAEAMAVIPEQEEQHWRQAMNCFLRCVEVCGNRRHDARVRSAREGRRDLW